MTPHTAERTGPLVLIVDDDPRNVRLLEAIFRMEGYATISALNGPAGRAAARERRPDIILLDIMMPEESGFDTCAILKQTPDLAEIPIIFLSAIDDTQSKVNGLNIGAVDYITKPFARAEVLARTRLHLNLRQAYKAVIDAQAAKLQQIRDAQQAILVRPEDIPQARFGVDFTPVLEAGGDYYDVFSIASGITGYFVADVSGHDIGVSYMTSALKALISQNATPTHTPVETVRMMNGVLRTIFSEGRHLTFIYAHLNRLQCKLTLVAGGHPPAVFVPRGGVPVELKCSGDILGVFPCVSFEPLEMRVNEGDRLFLYTDGLVERFTPGRKRNRGQGLADLLEACGQVAELPIQMAVDRINEAMLASDNRPQDDVIIMGIEV